MHNRRGAWALAGLVTGLAGLATAYVTSALLGLRGNPVTDVAELVIRLTPGQVAEQLIQVVGRKDKPLLVTGVLVVVLLLFVVFGLLSRRSPGAGVTGVRRARRGRARRQPVAVPGARRRGSCRSWSAC